MSCIYMFSGSSSVGKTTTLALVRKNAIVVNLTARSVRAKFGNPSWADIINDKDLCTSIQTAQLEYFLATLNDTINENLAELQMPLRSSRPIIVERSAWDVIGYSMAFQLDKQVIDKQIQQVENFEDRIFDLNVNANIVTFEIDPKYPYALIPERPPEHIRNACAKSLSLLWLRDVQISRISRQTFQSRMQLSNISG